MNITQILTSYSQQTIYSEYENDHNKDPDLRELIL